jgi:hypothetical protein
MTGFERGGIGRKLIASAALIALGEAIVFEEGMIGAALGGFALAWLAALVMTRPAVLRDRAARIAALAAGGFALVLVDDPGFLTLLLFAIAVSLAALLPRRRFDDAIAWAGRLVWHGVSGLGAPLRDLGKIGRVRERRRYQGLRLTGMISLVALPIVGGALFLTLFANANPLIADAFSGVRLPGLDTVVLRTILAAVITAGAWPMLRPAASTTRQRQERAGFDLDAVQPGPATLTLSLVVFNAIFAVQNALDIAFLWSGAPLPSRVTMAEYAHQGAYALIVTALLAGAFVLVALRPGSVGAASATVRRLVTVWIAQNVLLVASSALRTLDYVAAYGMTTLRLAALAWMALVATGLVLIGWRLLRGRSAAWLINANALAAALVLAVCSVVDLGAAAAAWNARVALAMGRQGPPLDLCYLHELGPSAIVSVAQLERHASDPAIRDRLAFLRVEAQDEIAIRQSYWRGWTWRNARRTAQVETMVRPVRLRPAPYGRECNGAIRRPNPLITASMPPQNSSLTGAAQR